MKDLIDEDVGTKFYLPPVRGLWSGKIILKDGIKWVEVAGREYYDFELKRGDYIIGENIRLGEMPHYSMHDLAYADW